MNNKITVFILAPILLLGAEKLSAEELKTRLINDLENASQWIITEALGEYFSGTFSNEEFKKHLIENFYVQLYTSEIIVEDNKTFFRMPIKSGGIHYDIYCLHRETFDKVYEYWIVQISGRDWANQEDDCYYVITESNTLHSKRTIIRKENVFFQTHKLGNNNSISFPVNNLKAVFWLSPWNYPEKFKDSELLTYKVTITADGEYKKTELSWWDKFKRVLAKIR